MKKLLLLLLTLCPLAATRAQGDISLGSWRTHFSYSRVQALALAGERVYAASENGLFYYDKSSKETFALGPLKGFSDVGVSALAWYAPQKMLFIGYRSGSIDLLQEGKLSSIPNIREADFKGAKAINAVSFRGDSAVVATDYGISIISLSRRLLLDSYLSLGPAGESVAVHDVAIWQDSIYAATSRGLIVNRLGAASRLNDFSSWQRYGAAQGLPEEKMFLEVADEQLWLLPQSGALYRKKGAGWEITSFTNSTAAEVSSLMAGPAGDVLIISSQAGVSRYFIAQNKVESPAYPQQLQNPLVAAQDQQGNLWVGDANNGLLAVSAGNVALLSPAGPLHDNIRTLQYANGQLLALAGGASQFGAPLGVQGFSTFSTAEGWVNYHPNQRAGSRPMPAAQDLSAAAFSPLSSSWYLASYSDGLLVWQPQESKFSLYGLQTPGVSFSAAASDPGRVLLSTVAVDAEGKVWMGSNDSQRPLHQFNPADGSWQYYLQGSYFSFQQMVIPYTGDLWLSFQPGNSYKGILVFNPAKQISSRFLDKRTNNGSLVSDEVNVMQEDREGSVWVGTSDGLSYFVNPSEVLSSSPVDAALPVYQLRPLLDESKITALAVDGGNRKWIGTQNGLWLFGQDGDTLFHHFTTANSPLPSNNIRAISVQQQTGEVFIATDKGLVSYRSGATAGELTHAGAIKIFPNPVRPDFRGLVGITGLVQDAVVKITDAAGFLVRELPAYGSTASWDLRDSRGNAVVSGVYLVFSANELGTEALVGKVAVVR